MRHTLQFLGLMACGLLLIGMLILVAQSLSGVPVGRGGFGQRSAVGIDYVSFGIGLAMGLTLAELARLSWADMPRRAIAWLIGNRDSMKYGAYACIWLAVLIYV